MARTSLSGLQWHFSLLVLKPSWAPITMSTGRLQSPQASLPTTRLMCASNFWHFAILLKFPAFALDHPFIFLNSQFLSRYQILSTAVNMLQTVTLKKAALPWLPPRLYPLSHFSALLTAKLPGGVVSSCLYVLLCCSVLQPLCLLELLLWRSLVVFLWRGPKVPSLPLFCWTSQSIWYSWLLSFLRHVLRVALWWHAFAVSLLSLWLFLIASVAWSSSLLYTYRSCAPGLDPGPLFSLCTYPLGSHLFLWVYINPHAGGFHIYRSRFRLSSELLRLKSNCIFDILTQVSRGHLPPNGSKGELST